MYNQATVFYSQLGQFFSLCGYVINIELDEFVSII